MITEHDLQEAIAECEGQRNPSASTCLKLAAFYTIKDKLFPVKDDDMMHKERNDYVPRYSYASFDQRFDVESDTEFMQVVADIEASKFLSVMDELMMTLKTIMPRLYDGVMRKLKEN